MRRYQAWLADSARWDGFEFRPGDIVITTPPKAGTTWTQTLCALLIFRTPEFPAPVDELCPWLDMLTAPLDEVRARLAAQTHRRFIKTHVPLDGVPEDDAVRYVVVGRDPRDIAISWQHHMENANIERMAELRAAVVGPDPAEANDAEEHDPEPSQDADRFAQFIKGRDEMIPPNVRNVLHHLEIAWERRNAPSVGLFHYSDMLADPPGELGRLAEFLDISIGEVELRSLAAEADINVMRREVRLRAPGGDKGYWHDPAGFFRSGTTGDWRSLVRPEDLVAYDELVAELVPPDLADWVHNGRRGVAA